MGFWRKSAYSGLVFSQETRQFQGWVWKVETPICGLQLHGRISLGRLETTCRKGHLWEPQMRNIFLHQESIIYLEHIVSIIIYRQFLTENTMVIFLYFYFKVHLTKNLKIRIFRLIFYVKTQVILLMVMKIWVDRCVVDIFSNIVWYRTFREAGMRIGSLSFIFFSCNL
jgi:hypothetical protein